MGARARLLCCLALGLALTCAAQTAQDTVTGRQVPAPPGAEPVARTTSTRSVYVVHCAGCHGMDGAGTRIGQVPDMRQLGQFLRLDGGREFLIKVPGVMGSGLGDRQVAEVSNWVLRTLAAASLPPDFVPYGAEEVARARSAPLLDVAATRRKLVAQGRERGLVVAE